MSELKVNKISPASGTETTLGDSSDDFLLPSGVEIIAQSGSTITVASGATITNSGTATGFGGAGPTLATPVATTSGTTIDFTSIPSGTKSISIAFSGVGTNGASPLLVQIGDSGGIETSGYLGTAERTGDTWTNPTTGFGMGSDFGTVVVFQGIAHLILLDSATYTWSYSCAMGRSDQYAFHGAGAKSLSAELDRVRITATNGSDAFTVGKINIQYE
jgi:hypothetical protein